MSKNQKTVMLSSQFRPGCIYSVIYDSPVDMVQTRFLPDNRPYAVDAFGDAMNPLIDLNVTVRRVASVQAAGTKTWANFKRKTDPTWEPSGRAKWYSVTDNSCIVEHNKNATRYLRALPRGITKEEYFIGGTPATPEQVQTIKTFQKNVKDSEFLLLNLDNLVNVFDDGGEEE